MSKSSPNLHRSFAALILGNLIGIFVSSVVALLICQNFFPGFFQDFLEHSRARKAAENVVDQPAKGQKNNGQQGIDSDDNGNDNKEKKSDAADKDPSKKVPDKKKQLEFPLSCSAVFVGCDLLFAAIAGVVCVVVAGFAKFNHVILLALFLGVWKFQLLIGFVPNQLPKTQLLIELIAVPLACLFAASFFIESADPHESDDDGLRKAFEPGPRDHVDPSS